MRVIDMEDILGNMRDELHFVLRCEEVFHDKIGIAAENIFKNKRTKPIVCMTGPSGSGKTTTAMRLKEYLENLGVQVRMVSMDNFFLPRSVKTEGETVDLESPTRVKAADLTESIDRLLNGETVRLPQFDFVNDCVSGYTEVQGDRDAVIITEGIHMLNPLIFDRMKDRAVGAYVAPRTRILTEKDRVIRPEQLRVARRMLRDYRGRGHSLRETVERAESVDVGEMKYIQPYKQNATIHIDTFHDYELCIFARWYREHPELFGTMDAAFIEKYELTDLLAAMQTLPPLKTEYVPLDSVVREFVGGSRYAY